MKRLAYVVSSQDYGKDEDAATKALIKHKVYDLYMLCVYACMHVDNTCVHNQIQGGQCLLQKIYIMLVLQSSK